MLPDLHIICHWHRKSEQRKNFLIKGYSSSHTLASLNYDNNHLKTLNAVFKAKKCLGV